MRKVIVGLLGGWAVACTGEVAPATDAAATSDASKDSGQAALAPSDRPILLWTGADDEHDSGAVRNAAILPKSLQDPKSEPDPHACGKDPTRQYIGEIFQHGINDLQVNWHWSPVLSGPNEARRSVDQPELSMSGTVLESSEPGDDVLADHPFGADFNATVQLDAPFTMLAGGHFESEEEGGHGLLHTELEDRIFTRQAFGFVPKGGDRTLSRGAWILDCGHPPYGTEMHPPTFTAYAREVPAKSDKPAGTQAVAFVAPYRSSLLFNPDAKLATAFSNLARFDDPATLPFAKALISLVVSAVSNGAERLTAHALMVPTRFDTLDWLVCAPLPRPAGAKLSATWRLFHRSGVQVKATPDEVTGCVRFEAAMTNAYQPMDLPHATTEWAWEELSKSASGQLGQSIDVRLEVIKLIKNVLKLDPSSVPALQADHPPLVDAYATLQPHAGADADSPLAVEMDDQQPFPFHGRIFVGWQKP
jgi:hypothetical protein